MTKVTFASHPHMLGFEQLDRLLERSTKAGADSYPPYNIEQIGENAYRITLAVAGFTECDLSVVIENAQLVIKGAQNDHDDAQNDHVKDKIFLHRGIASRQFQRIFVLADGVEPTGALLEHGLLHIDLQRRALENVVHTIEIRKR